MAEYLVNRVERIRVDVVQEGPGYRGKAVSIGISCEDNVFDCGYFEGFGMLESAIESLDCLLGPESARELVSLADDHGSAEIVREHVSSLEGEPIGTRMTNPVAIQGRARHATRT